jgi:flagellar hook-associated protein 1 FlgK
MSLTAAMETARSNLSVLTAKTSVISRNIANTGNEYASRKIVHTTTGLNGTGVHITGITRASDEALFRNVLSANSDASYQKALVDAMDQLNATINDTEQDASPAALIGKLKDALQEYSASPGELVRAQSTISAAGDIATALNTASKIVQNVRIQSDQDIAGAVATINSLLEQYGTVNQKIIDGTRLDADITDSLDARDKILADLSQEIGIKTVAGNENDLSIYTDSGVTLFQHSAREVTFDPITAYSASDTGNAVMIDDVAVTGSGATMPITSGRIKGLSEIRDDTAVTYQSQLDEVARGLIEMFAETDQSGSSLPDATGLFSYSGSPTVPATGTLVSGLAGEISLNAAFDINQGGDPTLLRDGGANGASYVYNTTGASGYSEHIRELIDEFGVDRSFDTSALLGGTLSLEDYASSSVGWLEGNRQSAASAQEYSTTVLERASYSLTSVIGANLDYEMSILLDLEHSFQATSRLISAIDSMYASLLEAGGR